MNKIWAPWRITYIQKTKSRNCIFCGAAKNKKNNKKHLVLLRGKKSFSILNLYPYNNGHFMVSPYRHIKNIEQLNKEEALDIFDVLKKTKQIMNKILKPQGYNIGINIGEISGAGIAGHIHVHVVPRWSADTNFMPVVSDTKIISQSLQQLFKKFKQCQRKQT